jgi:DNA polymerase-3 subunit gamma/tau
VVSALGRAGRGDLGTDVVHVQRLHGVDDLLERRRHIIVVAATRYEAGAVLRGVPADEIERMQHQAAAYGTVELSRAADVVNSSLTEMTGATSPRLHLELMAARLLVPAADDSARATLARVERLERRIGIEGADAAPAVESPAPVAERPAATQRPAPAAERPAPASERPAPAAAAQVGEERRPDGAARLETAAAEPPPAEPAAAPAAKTPATPATPTVVTLQQLRDAWPEILDVVQGIKRGSWMVVYTSTPRAYDSASEVLTLSFPSDNDVQSFRQAQGAGESVSEHLRQAILQVLGVRVKFIARVEGAASGASAPAPASASASASTPASAPAPTPASTGWNVAAIPNGAPASDDDAPPPNDDDAPPPDEEPEPAAPVEADDAPSGAPARPKASASTRAPQGARPPSNPNRPGRYGEAVVREVLKASFIEEVQLNPSDRPVRLVEEPEPAPAATPAAVTAEPDGGA